MSGPADPEGALAALAQGGLRGAPERAFELLERAWPLLTAWLGRLLRALHVPEDIREDCGQAALLRVWRSRTSYRGATTGELLAWVRRIVRNEAARLAVASERRRADPEEAPEPSAGDATSEAVLHGEARGALEHCLDELHEDQREVIEYLYSKDAPSEREVAAIVGLSKTRVNTLRQEALRRLQACLRRKGIE